MFDYLFFCLFSLPFLISFMFLLHFYFVFVQSSTATTVYFHFAHPPPSLSLSLFLSNLNTRTYTHTHTFGLITYMNSLHSIYVHVFERRSRWHRQMNESNLLALNHGLLVVYFSFFGCSSLALIFDEKTTFFPLLYSMLYSNFRYFGAPPHWLCACVVKHQMLFVHFDQYAWKQRYGWGQKWIYA